MLTHICGAPVEHDYLCMRYYHNAKDLFVNGDNVLNFDNNRARSKELRGFVKYTKHDMCALLLADKPGNPPLALKFFACIIFAFVRLSLSYTLWNALDVLDDGH